MKHSSRLLTPLAVCLAIVATRCVAEEGFTDLLAGDALSDTWRGYNEDASPDSWRLEEGVLRLEGSGGDLVTQETYGDFDFRFEWKIAPGGNSGVMYRVVETDEPAYHTGPEYQVFDPSESSDDLTGPAALYGLYPAPPSASKPAGQWNTGRITVSDGRVEHWVNGQKVVSTEIGSKEWNDRVSGSKFAAWDRFAKADAGRLALQDHGSKVWYRNLRVKRLGDSQDAAKQSAAKKPAGSGPHRVLFVTQSAGYKHSSVTRKASDLSVSEQVMKQLGLRSGEFRVDCTQDVETDFTPELLANYDVVAFYTTGDLPIPEATREWFLEDWLAEQGNGFLGIHAAADTYHDYEPYWDMLGGTFDGHPWTADTDVVLRVHSGDHPASAPWGAPGALVRMKEEIYQFKHWQPEKVRVLMSLDMGETDLKRPRHIPVLWVKDYGRGRVMHMSLGHREDVWTNPRYQESLIGGIEWLLGLRPGDATPNPELSAEEQRAAEQAAGAAAAAGG
ncbi:family 16 glycoside hydrolase [Botrimarina sp.]|uniref:family 16 glycoside hydrolase n=1 Tax=Botrimarina sp. TaxID=2795802 RepID=UPI0032ED7CC4